MGGIGWIVLFGFFIFLLIVVTRTIVQEVESMTGSALPDDFGWWVFIALAICAVVIWNRMEANARKKKERQELRSLPGKIQDNLTGAQQSYTESVAAFSEAEIELNEGRAVLFWDKVEEHNQAFVECSKSLLDAHTMIEDYNSRAPKFKLDDPAQLDLMSTANAFEDLKAIMDEMDDLQKRAHSAGGDFATIYETRRQTAALKDSLNETRSKLDQLEKLAARALSVAEEARAASLRAPQDSKRATGDWF